MNLLSPFEAQEQYPDAWRHIEDEMKQARDGYARACCRRSGE